MQKRALIVGLGIAGMATAIGLRRAGWAPVIIERAPERRTGGYFIGLLPDGRQAADDLGIADYLRTRTPDSGTVWSLKRDGTRKPGLGFLDQPGRPSAVLRGDIEAALWHGITEPAPGESDIEVRYATTPVEITEGYDSVEVRLSDAATSTRYNESFDLVIGADGLRSSVRQMVFGPHERFMTNWNAMICAFQLPEQVPGFAPQDSIISARSKRAAWVFALADRAPTALLTYCVKDIDAEFTDEPIERLRTVYQGMDDPAVRYVLDSLPQATDYLFDSVHQVRMPRWSQGRVMLLGDAAWCLNLYSGMGASASLKGGAELGRALRENPDDINAAMGVWEARLRPFITKHQRTTRLKQQMLVPTNRCFAAVRSLVVDLAARVRRRSVARETTQLNT
ncbi:FAD-dependent monooxygenase [Micromonospora sp. NBC_01412]|uniref:FAD-dependent monooxygenase n=1 Tax=Micromonospora sp. NBC_01412 TaxID=2903590 RepID=UPI00324CB0F0